jgi:hypothetical protein
MKTIQKLCAAMTLIFVLSIAARAGEISTNVVSPPPPPPSATVAAPGEIGTGAATVPAENQVESKTLLSQLTLSLLQLLSVI